MSHTPSPHKLWLLCEPVAFVYTLLMKCSLACALLLGLCIARRFDCMKITATASCIVCAHTHMPTSVAVTARREELLAQSKAWITPETLDARIDAALNTPIELYESASDRQHSPGEDS